MKNIYFLFIILLASCAKLDNNLYNNDNKIKEYKFDDYTGEQDFVLDGTYTISSGLITLFTLSSQPIEGETNPTDIKAIYIGDISKINTDTVILYCHGNKGHIDFYWQRAKLLAHVNGKNKHGVLMMDYRGYGLSKGKPTEKGMYADVSASMLWLKNNGLSNNRLIIYGFSLGTASACELSANAAPMIPSKIILEAPFASVAVMVHDASQLNMPAEYFTDLKIDNAEEIKKCQQPLLWMHGKADNFLNYKTHGEVVYKNYNGIYKENFLVEGADHGEVPRKMGYEKYLKVIGDFIRKP
ncbi:MAG: alpha/beta hydrolase [Bacteroidetes bacterium]|nr:alpha/beta hydrolase [Bacteroidota bacterium]